MIKPFIALVLLQATAAGAPARDDDRTSMRGVDQLLLQEVRRIAARVETLRGEAFVRPPFAVRVPDGMREVATEIRAFAVLPRDRVAARGRAWGEIGLGGPETPRDLLLALAADLDGIGFDPHEERLLVTPGRLRPEDFEPTEVEDDPATVLMLTGMRPDEPLVAHLLAHVRQHERWGGDSLQPTTDALLAAAAWAEGEANLVAMGYLFSGIAVGSEVLPFLKSPGEVLEGRLLPPGMEEMGDVERALVEFVYLDGFERAAERYAAGGWGALSAAMGRSTRDLLHPHLERFAGSGFGALEPPEEGLVAADVDTLGEQAIVVLVASLTGKDSLGLLAGDGWAGDRLVRWEREDGRGMTEWVTRWTTADAAADFDYAYGRALAARFTGRELADVGPGARTLLAPDRLYRLERRGAEVRVLARPVAAGPGSDGN